MHIERWIRGRVHYGWIVAGVTFLTLLAAAGIRSTPGVLMIPLEREFGWTRATVSFAVSLNIFLYGLSGPFVAGLMDRLGIRRVMVTSLALVATGVGLTTLMTAAWQLTLLWGVVVGLGTGTMAMVLGAMVANRWFTERRGFVLGLLTASSATGQLLFLPVLASMVVHLGWRSAVLLTAGVGLVVLPLVAVLMRDDPRDIGLRPFGEPADAPVTPRPPRAAATAPLLGLALGLRSRDFWLLAGSFFICGLSTNGLIGTHLIPASMEHSIPEVTAASLLASIGVLDVVGTTVSGWLSDRWDNRYLLCWYYGLRGLASAGSRCCSCPTRSARRTSASPPSRSSTASTGWPRCRRRRAWRPTPSAGRTSAPCSAGSPPLTSSARRRPPTVAVCSVRGSATIR